MDRQTLKDRQTHRQKDTVNLVYTPPKKNTQKNNLFCSFYVRYKNIKQDELRIHKLSKGLTKTSSKVKTAQTQ